jgi:hypothetical protein
LYWMGFDKFISEYLVRAYMLPTTSVNVNSWFWI